MARCTSKWGYARCPKPQGHEGSCEANGYRWQRGRGHMKPRLLHDPTSPSVILAERAADHRLTFGIDRLPERERECPAWRPDRRIAGQGSVKDALVLPTLRSPYGAYRQTARQRAAERDYQAWRDEYSNRRRR